MPSSTGCNRPVTNACQPAWEQTTHKEVSSMRSWVLLVLTLAVGIYLPETSWAGRSTCEILRDKGILKDDIEFNECKASEEKKEENFVKTVQDFAKNWIAYKEGTGFVINSAQMAPGDYRNPTPKP